MRIVDGEIMIKFEGNFRLGTELRKWGEVFQRPSNGKRIGDSQIVGLFLYVFYSITACPRLTAPSRNFQFHSLVHKKKILYSQDHR